MEIDGELYDGWTSACSGAAQQERKCLDERVNSCLKNNPCMGTLQGGVSVSWGGSQPPTFEAYVSADKQTNGSSFRATVYQNNKDEHGFILDGQRKDGRGNTIQAKVAKNNKNEGKLDVAVKHESQPKFPASSSN